MVAPTAPEPQLTRSWRDELGAPWPVERATPIALGIIMLGLGLGLGIEDAIAHPRMHVDLASGGGRVALEPGLVFTPDTDLEVALFPEIGMYFGGVGAALFDRNSGFRTGADPRREGATFVSS